MPGPTIVLHQYELSPFCEKVRRILHHKGVDYEVAEVPPSTAPVRIPRFNPIGKLPVVAIDDELIADSTEIAHALEARFPERPLQPSDPADRARCHVLEDWADESLYFYEMTMRFAWPENARRWAREAVAHDHAWFKPFAPRAVPWMLGRRLAGQGLGHKPRELVLREVLRHLDALESLTSSRDWLVGHALSLADVAVASQVTAIGGAREGGEALAERPALTAWLARTDDAAPPSARRATGGTSAADRGPERPPRDPMAETDVDPRRARPRRSAGCDGDRARRTSVGTPRPAHPRGGSG